MLIRYFLKEKQAMSVPHTGLHTVEMLVWTRETYIFFNILLLQNAIYLRCPTHTTHFRYQNQPYLSHTKALIIMVEGNRAVSKGNPQLFACCCRTFPDASRHSKFVFNHLYNVLSVRFMASFKPSPTHHLVFNPYPQLDLVFVPISNCWPCGDLHFTMCHSSHFLGHIPFIPILTASSCIYPHPHVTSQSALGLSSSLTAHSRV